MIRYFVTGTDTEIGKTVVSSILTLALDALYWKPIGSGASDQAEVAKLTGLPRDRFIPTVYALQASLSPDQAAKRENIEIDMNQCQLPQTNRSLIIEGAGGVFTPLNMKHRIIDLIKTFACPAIVVARGTLGTINHSLLTIEALRNRDIPIKGMVFSGELNPESQATIEHFGQVKTLFHVPTLSTLTPTALKTWVEENLHEYC